MSRLVPLPRDVTTVAAVRPAPGRLAPLTLADPPSPEATPHVGRLAVPSPYRTGVLVAGRYRLVEPLGRGGMGEVWRAQHVLLHIDVAVKFPCLARSGRAAEMLLSRFRFEAGVAARLGLVCRHVAAVHDAGSDETGPYLVMEYVRGPTLQAEIDEHGALPLPRAAAIVTQVAEALATAHERGLVHRDIKPSNVLLGVAPEGGLLVKVADFGIAATVRRSGDLEVAADPAVGAVIGSPPYMSPEQLAGAPASPAGDLWSLAVIAYEAVTGRLPFSGRSFAELAASQARGRLDPPSAVRPGVPAAVDAWFCRALAREEERRFSSVREMAAAFHEVAVGPRHAGPGWAERARACVRRCAGLSRP